MANEPSSEVITNENGVPKAIQFTTMNNKATTENSNKVKQGFYLICNITYPFFYFEYVLLLIPFGPLIKKESVSKSGL